MRLDDDKEMEVVGKGIVTVTTKDGKIKLLHDVQYVPKLAHNLLSVKQLMTSGYYVMFEGDSCIIKDKHSGVLHQT